MAAARSVDVPVFMAGAFVGGGAIRRVLVVDRQRVLVHMIVMRVMKVPVVEVIHVAVMENGDVAAVRAVDVIVLFVLVAAHGGVLEVLDWARPVVDGNSCTL